MLLVEQGVEQVLAQRAGRKTVEERRCVLRCELLTWGDDEQHMNHSCDAHQHCQVRILGRQDPRDSTLDSMQWGSDASVLVIEKPTHGPHVQGPGLVHFDGVYVCSSAVLKVVTVRQAFQ